MIPKFRVWLGSHKRWTNDKDSVDLSLDGSGPSVEVYEERLGEWHLWCLREHESAEVKISMSTGLFDRLGKEIYEGDILFYNFTDGEKGGMVGWNKTDGYWQLYWLDGDGLSPAWSWRLLGEIIGNKYENPELLKQAQ